MNQQTQMAILSAYPACKASDVLLWQELGLMEDLADGDHKARSLMSDRIAKILLTTRLSWKKS